MADKLLSKLAAVLHQAENAATPEEAEAFMAMAQMLSTRHSIDLATARSFTAEKTGRVAPIKRHIEIGEQGDRGAGAYQALFLAIAEVNDVYLILGNSGGWVDAYGMSTDIDQTEAMYAVLFIQMVRECNEYLQEGEWRDEGVTKLNARKSFYTGFRERVKHRLTEAKRAAEAQAESDYAAQGVSTSLVLKNQRNEVSSMYWGVAWGKKHFRVERGSSRHGRSAGDTAGGRARLHRSEELANRQALG